MDCSLFFFNDAATTEIYALSLHDALPISAVRRHDGAGRQGGLHRDDSRGHAEHRDAVRRGRPLLRGDRKSTRLNSSHANISYAVFCLKKKTESTKQGTTVVSPTNYVPS